MTLFKLRFLIKTPQNASFSQQKYSIFAIQPRICSYAKELMGKNLTLARNQSTINLMSLLNYNHEILDPIIQTLVKIRIHAVRV